MDDTRSGTTEPHDPPGDAGGPSDDFLTEPIPDAKVADWAAAVAERDRWKEQLPEVESAYTPSGRTSPMSTVLAIVGLPLGTAAGLLGAAAVSLVSLLAAAVVVGIPFFLWFRVLPDLALFLLPLFAGIALLVIGALSYGAAGYAAGRAAAFFARLGRNRSTTLVAIAAVVSALPIPMGNWWPTQEAPTRPAAVLAELGAEAIAKDAHHLAAVGPPKRRWIGQKQQTIDAGAPSEPPTLCREIHWASTRFLRAAETACAKRATSASSVRRPNRVRR